MTEIKTYCDKCGVELVNKNSYEDTDIGVAHYYRKVDLCSTCFEKLTDVIEEFFDKNEVTENEN